MFIFTTQLLVLPAGQAIMQTPADDLSRDTLNPSTLYISDSSKAASSQSLSRQVPHYQWLSIDNEYPVEKVSGKVSGKEARSYFPIGGSSLKFGGALTGTAIVSAGLAIPFSGERAISISAEDDLFTQSHSLELAPTNDFDGQVLTQAALDRGEGISPQVLPSNQVAFSQRSPGSSTRASHARRNNTQLAGAGSLLTRQTDGSWTLAYDVPSLHSSGQSSGSQSSLAFDDSIQSEAAAALSTQAIVQQLAREAAARTASICLDSSCRSLDYIQSQLPKAQKDVQKMQQKIAEFESKYAQGDLAGYQAVLAERISEISTQESQVAIELSETQRYISHLKATLSTMGVSSDWAEQLLAVDDDYQTSWLKLQQVEAQLLEEFSAANVDMAALNRVYNQYELAQQGVLSSAQAVLGNYLLQSGVQTSAQAGVALEAAQSFYKTPAALDILQALAVAVHQRDMQQLRQQTVKSAQSRLRHRHQVLAGNISEYEALKRELAAAEGLVTQYESRRNTIASQAASAAPLMAEYVSSHEVVADAADSLALAQALEPTLPEGSVGKAILGIVLAAGAVAIAAQRRSGDVSKALAVDIMPRKRGHQHGHWGFGRLGARKPGETLALEASDAWGSKRLENPFKPDWLSEVRSLIEPSEPQLVAIGPKISAPGPVVEFSRIEKMDSAKGDPEKMDLEALPEPLRSIALGKSSEVESEFEREAMSRDLAKVIANSTPESQFASEVRDRIENKEILPIHLPIEQIDAFAESAVQWVLRDLRTQPEAKVR